MNTRIRRMLEMIARVREFCKAHPSDDPAFATDFAVFEQHIAKAEEIASREQGGRAAGRAARLRRRELRKELHFRILHYLVAVVDRAAKELPELAELIALPSSNLTYRGFVDATRHILAAAAPHKALLVRNGMSDTLLDDLGQRVAELEAATDAARTSRRDHIGARFDFDVVGAELLEDVRVLGGIYRYRFGTDQQLMAEWEVVRQVPGLPRPKLTVESGGQQPEAAPQPAEAPKQEKDGTAPSGPGSSPRAA